MILPGSAYAAKADLRPDLLAVRNLNISQVYLVAASQGPTGPACTVCVCVYPDSS